MPADNTVYDDLAHTWWDEEEFLHLLRSAFNARFDYYVGVLERTGVLERATGPGGRRPSALDLGCGGGLLLDQFHGAGLQVTGIDPSHAGLLTAAAVTRERGVRAGLVQAVGERLPFADASFDVVYCCDVLEHVASVDAVVGEAARVLRPGGLFLFDTLNRTWRGWFGAILLAQEWSATAFMPRGLHGWDMFVRPHEVRAAVARHGLVPGGITGLGPAGGYPGYARMIWCLRQRAAGRISFAEMSRRVPYVTTRDISIAYAGWAVRPADRYPAGPTGAAEATIRPASSTRAGSSVS